MKPLQKSRSNFNTPTVAAEDAKSLISSQSAPRTRTNSGDVVLTRPSRNAAGRSAVNVVNLGQERLTRSTTAANDGVGERGRAA